MDTLDVRGTNLDHFHSHYGLGQGSIPELSCSSTRHEQKLSICRFFKTLDVAMVSMPWPRDSSIGGDAFLSIAAG